MADSTPAPVIAIDGPSASGKGTVAQRVATELGFHYLDSGALYRAAALVALEAGTNLENESDIAHITMNINVIFDGEHVRLESRDITDAIREERVGVAASRIASWPKVRAALLGRQRSLRRPPGLVAEGRDMGSVVFPDAALKIFLTASVEARAERRYKQLMGKGLRANMAALLHDIRARDARDSERAVAPLQKSAGAIVLDTTGMPVEEVVAQVLARYKQAPQVP
ncbi:MAG: (d)CMP kinase [Betaproteobacteria bacterium]|nr:(d)CMP kinase [Betaproteobacteria bacterium]